MATCVLLPLSNCFAYPITNNFEKKNDNLLSLIINETKQSIAYCNNLIQGTVQPIIIALSEYRVQTLTQLKENENNLTNCLSNLKITAELVKIDPISNIRSTTYFNSNFHESGFELPSIYCLEQGKFHLPYQYFWDREQQVLILLSWLPVSIPESFLNTTTNLRMRVSIPTLTNSEYFSNVKEIMSFQDVDLYNITVLKPLEIETQIEGRDSQLFITLDITNKLHKIIQKEFSKRDRLINYLKLPDKVLKEDELFELLSFEMKSVDASLPSTMSINQETGSGYLFNPKIGNFFNWKSHFAENRIVYPDCTYTVIGKLMRNDVPAWDKSKNIVIAKKNIGNKGLFILPNESLSNSNTSSNASNLIRQSTIMSFLSTSRSSVLTPIAEKQDLKILEANSLIKFKDLASGKHATPFFLNFILLQKNIVHLKFISWQSNEDTCISLNLQIQKFSSCKGRLIFQLKNYLKCSAQLRLNINGIGFKSSDNILKNVEVTESVEGIQKKSEGPNHTAVLSFSDDILSFGVVEPEETKTCYLNFSILQNGEFGINSVKIKEINYDYDFNFNVDLICVLQESCLKQRKKKKIAIPCEKYLQINVSKTFSTYAISKADLLIYFIFEKSENREIKKFQS